MVRSYAKRAALLLLLCAALLTTAFASAPSVRSDISIRITPPGGEAVQRAEVEVQLTDNTGSGLQTAHVKVGDGNWREVTGQLDRTDNLYHYVAEVTENGTVSVRVIGQDGTVFEKSEDIDCFIDAPGETTDKSSGEDSGQSGNNSVPLTPEGQGSVLDNATDEDGKEFFTFTTPNENVFYLVVDRQKNGENVYFLNAVTESDLMELAEKDGEDAKTGTSSISAIPEPEPEPEPVCDCGEKCEAGAVNKDCPVCVLRYKDCESKTTAPAEDGGKEPEKTEKAGNKAGMIFIVLVALAVGGAGYYFKIYKPRRELDEAEDFDQLTGGEETVNEDEVNEDVEDVQPDTVPIRARLDGQEYSTEGEAAPEPEPEPEYESEPLDDAGEEPEPPDDTEDEPEYDEYDGEESDMLF